MSPTPSRSKKTIESPAVNKLGTVLENPRANYKRSASGATGVLTESMASSQNNRKPIDLVLHKHPLHKDRNESNNKAPQ